MTLFHMNISFANLFILIHFNYFVIGHTRVINVPPCFGVTTESKSHRLIYLTFSPSSPAYTLKTPVEGVVLSNAPDTAWINCMYALKVPRHQELSTLYLFLNYGSLDTQEHKPTGRNMSTEVKLLFYYKTLDDNITKYGKVDFISNTWAASGPIGVNNWSERPNTIYITLAHVRGESIPAWIRFSITLTPIYSCPFGKTEGRVSCTTLSSTIIQENIPCVSASLTCDGHSNCPNFENNLHTTDESPKLHGCNWKGTRKTSTHLIYGSIAGFLFLAFTFTLFFSIPELTNLCRDCSCFRKKLREPTQSTSPAEDYNLPIAPPPYSSVGSRNPGEVTRCSLFRTPNPIAASAVYELPPSYVLDDEADICYSPNIEPNGPSVWSSCAPLKRENIRRLRPMLSQQYIETFEDSSAPGSSMSQASQSTTTCAELPTYTEAVNSTDRQTTRQ